MDLDIADRLFAGPMTAREDAAATGTLESRVVRLLRYLGGLRRVD